MRERFPDLVPGDLVADAIDTGVVTWTTRCTSTRFEVSKRVLRCGAPRGALCMRVLDDDDLDDPG